jgi:hypothetical protein
MLQRSEFDCSHRALCWPRTLYRQSNIRDVDRKSAPLQDTFLFDKFAVIIKFGIVHDLVASWEHDHEIGFSIDRKTSVEKTKFDNSRALATFQAKELNLKSFMMDRLSHMFSAIRYYRGSPHCYTFFVISYCKFL